MVRRRGELAAQMGQLAHGPGLRLRLARQHGATHARRESVGRGGSGRGGRFQVGEVALEHGGTKAQVECGRKIPSLCVSHMWSGPRAGCDGSSWRDPRRFS